MPSNTSDVLLVNLNFGQKNIYVGRLYFKDRKIFFEYDKSFISTGLEISPFKLPLSSGVIACEDRTFDGLFGVFNDSLPDGWGRLLLDRKLTKNGIQAGGLNPLERLKYVGKHGMGVLQYAPEITDDTQLQFPLDLDVLAQECFQVHETDNSEFIDELLVLNGSSAGARPKILVNLSSSEWLIKFRSSYDLKDIGNIEYAYHLMAKEAGLDVPNSKLFPSQKCGGYFGVERFDFHQNSRVHMHTLSGLLHADHRIPNLDYEIILRATQRLTKNNMECESQFRNAVFNIFSHNRDDHSKNFSFLMDENGTWKVSPTYDLTFSHGPGGEHCTTVAGEGKCPTKAQLQKVAKNVGIEITTSNIIIEEVAQAVSQWQTFASEAGVTISSTKLIQKTLNTLSAH